MLKVLLACDKFKSSLSAAETCRRMAAGVRRVNPAARINQCPIADGGEGTADILAAGRGASRTFPVAGPLSGQQVLGRVNFLDDNQTAVLDMATAAGLSLLEPLDRDPTRTTSFGVGQLIAAAADAGARRIIVGLGGSATCDAGIGAAQALGALVTLGDGPTTGPVTGGQLAQIREIHFIPERWRHLEVICLYDVASPLAGPQGSAFVFAPQKGATPGQVRELDTGLRNIAAACGAGDLADQPGMGAAGGLGVGLALACGAVLRRGAEAVADALGLDERLREADLCITGEGRFDATSLAGKATAEVAARAGRAGVPCILIAGSIEPGVTMPGLTAALSIATGPMTLEELIAGAGPLVEDAAARAVRMFLSGRGDGDRGRDRDSDRDGVHDRREGA